MTRVRSAARLPLAALAAIFIALAGCTTLPPSAPSPSDAGASAVKHALGMLGVPYRYGGSTPQGFDCSGLVQYSYARAGVSLPRDMQGLWRSTRPVAPAQIRPGDLVFFHLDGQRNSHVGLYVGDNAFVHAPSRGKHVSTASLSNPYWSRRIGGVRRAVDAAPALPE